MASDSGSGYKPTVGSIVVSLLGLYFGSYKAIPEKELQWSPDGGFRK